MDSWREETLPIFLASDGGCPAGFAAITPTAAPVTTPARISTSEASLHWNNIIDFSAPSVRAAAAVETVPTAGGPSIVNRIAAWAVASRRIDGIAILAAGSMTIPADGASPRRVRWTRRRSRPRARRLLTVPTGQPSTWAATSYATPSRSQSTIVARNRSGSRSISW